MRAHSATALVLTLIIGCQLISHAQFQQSWVQRFSTPGNEIPIAIKTNGSSVYVLAVTNRYTSAADALLIKYTSAGTFQWAQTYNGPGNNQETPSGLALDAAGNVYVVGWSSVVTGNGTSAETFTLKYSPAGSLLWASRYRRPDNHPSYVNAVSVDGSANVYVTGSTIAGSPFAYDFLTIKYNATGEQQWIATYDGTGNGTDVSTQIALDLSGNIYITGESLGKTQKGRLTINTYADYVTIKYDPAGNVIWQKRYGTSGIDSPSAIVVDAASNVYVTGESSNGTNNDFLTLKYDANGNLLWATRYNGPANGNDGARGLVANGSGECYVTGFSDAGSAFGNYNYKTIKYSSSGAPLWEQSFNGTMNGNDMATAIGIDHYGSVYVTGQSLALYSQDFATVKYLSTGVQSWVATYNGPGYGSDVAAAMAVYSPSGPVASNAAIYVTGESLGPVSGTDVAVVKYTQPMVIGGIASGSNISNYPNPLISSTTIEFGISEDSDVSIQVVDISTGKQIELISVGRKSAGRHSFHYEPSWQGRGNYVYRVIAQSASGRSIESNIMQIER